MVPTIREKTDPSAICPTVPMPPHRFGTLLTQFDTRGMIRFTRGRAGICGHLETGWIQGNKICFSFGVSRSQKRPDELLFGVRSSRLLQVTFKRVSDGLLDTSIRSRRACSVPLETHLRGFFSLATIPCRWSRGCQFGFVTTNATTANNQEAAACPIPA